MQLNLAFLDAPELPIDPGPAVPASTTWDHLDEEARMAALEILVGLIARVLAAEQAMGASYE